MSSVTRRIISAAGTLLVALALHSNHGIAAAQPTTACDPALAEITKQSKAELTQREFDGPVGESAEGSLLRAYYRADGSIALLDFVAYGETGRREVNYRLLNRETFDYSVTDSRYQKPLSVDPSGALASSTTRRYRVCDGKPVALTAADAEARQQDSAFARRLDELLALTKTP